MTLSELRAIVDQAEGLPDDAEVAVLGARMTLSGDMTPPLLSIDNQSLTCPIEIKGSNGPFA